MRAHDFRAEGYAKSWVAWHHNHRGDRNWSVSWYPRREQWIYAQKLFGSNQRENESTRQQSSWQGKTLER
jgi:hypothetical protein